MKPNIKLLLKNAIEYLPSPVARSFFDYYRDLSAMKRKYAGLVAEIVVYFRSFISDFAPPVEGRSELLSSLVYGTGISEALFIIDIVHQSLHGDGDVREAADSLAYALGRQHPK